MKIYMFKQFFLKKNWPVSPFATKISKIKTGIPLEITVFKCLIVSLVPLQFSRWQQHHFYLFQLVSTVCLWICCCQQCTFYCPLRKNRCTLIPDGTDIHIKQHIHQKDLNHCLPLYYYGNGIADLEKKHKQGI